MAKAFLFDLNGTMVDDMNYHIKAWHRITHELGGNLTLEQVKAECYGKNGEVLERIFPGRFSPEEKDHISIEKEKQYQKEFRPMLKLIDGLDIFLENAYRNNIKMGIGSAAILFNVDFVLDGLNIRHYFDAIISADDVIKSKPDPETFSKCALQLGVPSADCIVFEDAPKGVEAAANAGMKSVVLTTMHTPDEFAGQKNTTHFVKDFNDPSLMVLFSLPL
jgi:HAD superfamily hydrolase (TIGR01509 family)